MPRPPRQLPIIDFKRGARTNPAFQRGSQLAPLDLLNIEIEGQGRPLQRLGYVVENPETSGLQNGTQFVRLHSIPDRYSRNYRISSGDDWEYHKGRLFGVSTRGRSPYWYDVKNDIKYNWDLPKPETALTLEINYPDAISGDNYEAIRDRVSILRPTPNPFENETDIKLTISESIAFRMIVIDSTLRTVRVLHDSLDADGNNELSVGNQSITWDGDNTDGDALARGIYTVTIIDSDGNIARSASLAKAGEDGLSTDIYEVEGVRTIRDGGELLEAAGIRTGWWYFCYTYTNTDFAIETSPSPMERVYVASFDTEDDDPLDRSNLEISITVPISDVPEWADEVNLYVKRGFAPEDITEPKEVDWDWTFFGSQILSTLTDDEAGFLFTNEKSATPRRYLLSSTTTLNADGIPQELTSVMLYAERMWIWDNKNLFLRFSELGQYDKFPDDYALELSSSGESIVTAMHPAPTVSAFFVFKQDAIHIVRGTGILDGLRTQTLASTDLDASGVILQHGTLSPRTIVSGENGIYFISRDKKLKYLTIDGLGSTNVQDIGIAIDEFLAELTLREQKNLVAFLFNNCYHVIMPDYVLVLDLQKRYWVRNSWQLVDAFWSEGE